MPSLVLALVATACGGTEFNPDAVPTANDVALPPSAVISATSTLGVPTAEADCVDFRDRLVSGSIQLTTLFQKLNKASTGAQSITEIADASGAIQDWALAQQAWESEHLPDPRYRDPYDAYENGLMDLFRGSRSLSVLLIGLTSAPDSTVLTRAVAQMNDGVQQVARAVSMLGTTDCEHAATNSLPVPPTPSLAALPVDPRAAYLAVVSSINTRFRLLMEVSRDAPTFVQDLAALESEAGAQMARITFSNSEVAEVALLREAIASSLSILTTSDPAIRPADGLLLGRSAGFGPP